MRCFPRAAHCREQICLPVNGDCGAVHQHCVVVKNFAAYHTVYFQAFKITVGKFGIFRYRPAHCGAVRLRSKVGVCAIGYVFTAKAFRIRKPIPYFNNKSCYFYKHMIIPLRQPRRRINIPPRGCIFNNYIISGKNNQQYFLRKVSFSLKTDAAAHQTKAERM